MDSIPRNAEEYRQWWRTNYPHIPYGQCICSPLCGAKTTTSRATDSMRMRFKGEPCRYAYGHSGNATQNNPFTRFQIEDRGFSTLCWIWIGGKSHGYGAVTHNNRHMSAHKFFYEAKHGPLASGQDVHHLCNVSLCVNVDHLTPVSHDIHPRLRSNVKLSMALAEDIRLLTSLGTFDTFTLATSFGVGKSAINRIVSHKSWRRH